ncbi:MAG: DUF4173 domain-containing protein [Clostridia bacterium]|nr:DUF4173 domain-containing protein [Clostridia bacterium]
MKLDKKAKSVVAVYAIILALYVFIFLIIPTEKYASSWISFAFTVIAILCSLLICAHSFGKNDKLVSKIYGFPVFRIGVLYALIQLVAGIVICAVDAFVEVPYQIALVLSIILIGLAAIGFIATDNLRDHVEKLDEEAKSETKVIRRFRIDISSVAAACTDASLKVELEKLSEKFKFSDPVSNEDTFAIETVINNMLSELKILVNDGNASDAIVAVKEISLKLDERNSICKLTKK